jgi:transposase InsO family protein
MLDIFSRKVIHWEIHPGEDGDLAKAFMQHAIIANDGTRPSYIHADNGTSMTSRGCIFLRGGSLPGVSVMR